MKLKEDEASVLPANNAGSGNVEGIGVGPKGEPGVKKKRLRDIVMRPMITRKPT